MYGDAVRPNGQPLRVLVLSRNYPSPVTPQLGLWVERANAFLSRKGVEMRVVAPVPWFPPVPGAAVFPQLADFSRFRRVPWRQTRGGIDVHHPRFVVGPGNSLYAYEARTYWLGVRRAVSRLREDFPFDVIHGHFGYPDGVVAERLGREHQVPVVVTEHAPWRPWMDDCPQVRRQAVPAARRFACHVAVSRAVKKTIVDFTGDPSRVHVIPNGVDHSVFQPLDPEERDPDKLLFVGLPRPVKGVDVLLEAMVDVLARRPSTRLVVIGGAVYRGTRAHMAELQARAGQHPLAGRVSFEGLQPTAEVARHMATSAVVVLPSRLESFGAVLVEALACGTPVVSTFSGGPEDIVTPDVGLLVPVGDPPALARALLDVLEHPCRYPPDRVRSFAVERFSGDRVADRIVHAYRAALPSSGFAPSGGMGDRHGQ